MGSTIDLEAPLMLLALCIVGFLPIAKTLFKLVKWVWCMFFRPPKKLTKYGSWALITGCTDGIGKALSFELASKGLNLILVGRNPQKLQSTSNEIWEKFGKKTQFKIIDLDFAQVSGEQIEEKIRENIQGLDVGVLVNNVGLSFKGPRFFHEVDFEGIDSLLNVNIGSVTWVTKAVLPGMLQRKKGAIVNIGSGSSVAVPSYPLFTIYAATKAFEGIDFRRWQKKMHFLLTTLKVVYVLNMARPPEPNEGQEEAIEAERARSKWDNDDYICRGHILNAMSDALFDVYQLYGTAKELWNALENKYISEDASNL